MPPVKGSVKTQLALVPPKERPFVTSSTFACTSELGGSTRCSFVLYMRPANMLSCLISGADLPLQKNTFPSPASSLTWYLEKKSQPKITGSINPFITLHVIDIGSSPRRNFRHTSPIPLTFVPLMALPDDSEGVKNCFRYGLFRKYSTDIQVWVQPESARTGRRRRLRRMLNMARHFGNGSGVTGRLAYEGDSTSLLVGSSFTQLGTSSTLPTLACPLLASALSFPLESLAGVSR